MLTLLDLAQKKPSVENEHQRYLRWLSEAPKVGSIFSPQINTTMNLHIFDNATLPKQSGNTSKKLPKISFGASGVIRINHAAIALMGLFAKPLL
jgi:hypothetical protein